jgi:hypothetical protein
MHSPTTTVSLVKSFVKWNGSGFLAHHLPNFYFYELKLIILRHYIIVKLKKNFKKERLILIVGLATICGHKPMTPIATNRRGIPSCVKNCIYMI